MLEQTLAINLSFEDTAGNANGILRQEYQAYQNLYKLQTSIVQQFFAIQAAALAEAIVQDRRQAQFSLPDQVITQSQGSDAKTFPVPVVERKQQVGGFVDHLVRGDLRTALRLRFMELEHSENAAISTSGILMRHALAMHMVYNMLPAGKTVLYEALDGEEIPSKPVSTKDLSASTLAGRNGVGKFERSGEQPGREEQQVPYVEAARQFYLPQWVAFDEDDHLLLNNLSEAEAAVTSMQRYLSVLHAAVGMAAYMVADDEYQRKRYGILGQLVNQGRALASYEVSEIIHTIKRQAAAHELDRGLSLELPYFNDQTLALEIYCFDVIPVGRVMFVPAFLVLAVRAQGGKVAQDTRLDLSTRQHLLAELGKLESVFLR